MRRRKNKSNPVSSQLEYWLTFGAIASGVIAVSAYLAMNAMDRKKATAGL